MSRDPDVLIERAEELIREVAAADDRMLYPAAVMRVTLAQTHATLAAAYLLRELVNRSVTRITGPTERAAAPAQPPTGVDPGRLCW